MKKVNREWVKTFAIIFLAVLLVLTFFSSTIMNWTLPEVSTQYIQYGTIKTQVRGSGTVISQDNYSVTYSDTREIKRVAVRQGDSVNRGDVLFYLEEGESDELEQARENYESLRYEYSKMLINAADGDDFADKKLEISQLQEDLESAKEKLSKAAGTKAAIDEAKLDVRDAEKAVTQQQNRISELEEEKAAIGYTPTEDEVLTGKQSDVTYEQYASATSQINAAEDKIDDAKQNLVRLQTEQNTLKAAYDKVKKEYDEIDAKIETPLKTLEENIKTSDRNIESIDYEIKYLQQEFYNETLNSRLERLYDKFKSAQSTYRSAKSRLDSLRASGASESEIADAERAYKKANDAMEEAYNAYDERLTDESVLTGSVDRQLANKERELQYALEDNTELKSKLTETKLLDDQLQAKKKELDKAEKAYSDAQSAVNAAQTVYDNATADKELLEKSLSKIRNGYKYIKVKEYEDKIEAEKTVLENLNIDLDNKKEALSDLQAEGSDSEETLKERVKTLTRQLTSAEKSLADSIEQAGKDSSLQSLELEKAKKSLDKAEAEVQKLEAKVTSNEILAPVSGVVDSVSITAGEKIRPDSPLMEISLAEKGYKMSMTVTAEQAAKLRVGQSAEITGYVPYGSEIKVTLVSIKTDTQNPSSRQKILEFLVEGDVTVGQNLQIAVGDKNASYDNTVPNTAIREDSDGKYILVVESKSSPIGNRYIAKRVDVTVVASDDTRSAITGDFSSWSYVVATSSKPVNNGEQVKLID